MKQIKQIIKLTKQYEKLYEQWKHTLLVGTSQELDKLNTAEMEKINSQIKTIIGRRPTRNEYTYWSKMKRGDFTYTQLESEIQNRKETISS